MATEVEKNSRRTSEGQRCYIPARYVFAAVSTLGTFLTVVLRASLSVAITAMVRKNTTDTASNDTDTCPYQAVVNQTSISTVTGDFDWDEVTQSYVLTASGYGMLATTLLGARVSELWSRKYIYAISSSVAGAVFLLLPVTAEWNVNALIAFQVVNGIFMGPVMPVGMALSAAWFPPEERQLLGGFTLSAVSLGSFVSNAVTGNLVDSMGWPFVFYLFASLVVTWTILWMFFVFDSPNDHPRISEEERTYIIESTRKDEDETTARLPWKEMLLSRPMWAHIAMGLPSTWLVLTLSNALPTFLKNILHYSTTKAGYISAIPPIASYFSTIGFGFLSQWIRRRKYFSHLMTYHIFNGIGTLGTAAVLLCLPLVTCDEGATILLLSLAVACSAAYIGGSQLNHMDLAVNYAGTLFGVGTTFFSIVAIVAPSITGLLTNNQQTLTAWNRVFYVCAGVNIVPFFIYLLFGSVEEQPWNRSLQEDTDNNSESKASTVDIEVQSRKPSHKQALPVP